MIRNKKSLYLFFYKSILIYFVLTNSIGSSILVRNDLKTKYKLIEKKTSQDYSQMDPIIKNIIINEDAKQDKLIKSRWEVKYLFQNIPMISFCIFGIIMNISGILMPKINFSLMSYISCYYCILFISIMLGNCSFQSISSQLNLCVGVCMLGFIISILTFFFESVQHIIKGTSLASVIILLWIQIQINNYDFDQFQWFFVGYCFIVILVCLLSAVFPLVIMSFVTSVVGTVMVVFHGLVFFQGVVPFQEVNEEDDVYQFDVDDRLYGFVIGAVVMFLVGFSVQFVMFNMKYKRKREKTKI